MPNGEGIAKETYMKASPETQAAMTYDLLHEINKKLSVQMPECDKRFRALEKKKWHNTGLASGSGTLGGIIANILMKVFGVGS